MDTLKLPQLTRRDVDRFWKKVKMLSNGCWEWQAATKKKRGEGHAIFSFKNVHYGANRIAYYLYYLVDPMELYVLHRCDNPPCVNPFHLFLGTAKDNTQDMLAKGRQGFWDCVGEKNPAAKVGVAEVRIIRQKAAAGQYQRSIAKEFGITQSAVHLIVARKIWKHVT